MSALNQTQLIKRVRRSAGLEVNSVDWTDVNILEELNDVMTQLYARAVIDANQGHWQLTDYALLVAGQRSYRLPARAVMGTTLRQQISAIGNVDWFPIEDLSESDALRYEYSNEVDPPRRKIVRGENWWLLPPAAASGYVMRTHYMVRPSRIIVPQVNENCGRITAINTTTRVVTLADYVTSYNEDGFVTPGTTTTGTYQFDIIRPGGWFKVQWTGSALYTVSGGGSLTLASDPSGLSEANDLSDIAVGDYVRYADQTDWAAIPADFHRSLADATAAKILTARGMAQASSELSQAHVVPDLQRFGSLLRPRDGSSAFVLVAPEFV